MTELPKQCLRLECPGWGFDSEGNEYCDKHMVGNKCPIEDSQVNELKAYVKGIANGYVSTDSWGYCKCCGTWKDLRYGYCYPCCVKAEERRLKPC